MKNLWVIANWKSNKTIGESLEWISIVGPQVPRKENLKVVVCPPFSDLEEVKKQVLVGNYPLLIGCQDLSPYEKGAYTGEESAEFLRQFVDLAILGHSERREHFGETDEIIAQKTEQALKHSIIPLVCVQNADTLIPLNCKLVAYEPTFAIGTGISDTPEKAEEIATQLKQKYEGELVVLYGGSVNSDNISSFVQQVNINGVLVGQASLSAEEFVTMISRVS